MNIDISTYHIIFIIVGYLTIGCISIWQHQLEPQFIFPNLTASLVILHTLIAIGIIWR